MSLPVFTLFHVAISLGALLAGFVVAAGMLKGRDYPQATAAFLALTIATSVTGFLFPATQILPSHITGIISLVVLAAATAAYAVFRLKGPWRWIYAVGAMMAFYLNMFVTVVQAFLKVPALHELAPGGSESPFLIAQVIVLLAFVAAGVLAVKRFHPLPAGA
ncbi:MAG: hypothetical protein ACYCZX_10895 [Rhodospirillaceae bacterium]